MRTKTQYHTAYVEHLVNGEWVEYEYRIEIDPGYGVVDVVEDDVERTLDGKTWETVPFSVLLEGLACGAGESSLRDALDELRSDAYLAYREAREEEYYARGDALYDQWKDERW